MSIIIGSILLWGAGLYLLRKLWHEDRALFREALRKSRATFIFILPRIVVGQIGRAHV